MASLKVLLLPVVALLAVVEDTSAVNHYKVKDLYSEEAKTVMKEIYTYSGRVYSEIDKLGGRLQNHNDALTALKGYREMVDAAKGTTCKPAEDLDFDDDKELLNAFVNECADAMPIDELVKLENDLKPSKVKVKELDNTLMALATSCDPQQDDCDGQREKVVDQLNHVLTADVKLQLESEAQQALKKAQKYIEDCFSDAADELVSEIKKDTNLMSDCLSKLS